MNIGLLHQQTQGLQATSDAMTQALPAAAAGAVSQSFTISLRNPGDGGAPPHPLFQHQIGADPSNSQAGSFLSRIQGAVGNAPTDTPTVDATNDFAGGAGILAADPSQILFNTASQPPSSHFGTVAIVFNSTGTPLNVRAIIDPNFTNINGNKVQRLVFLFTHGTSGVPADLLTIAIGKQIDISWSGYLL